MTRGQLNLFVPWLVWGTVCSLWMWWVPGHEIVPYHLGFAGLSVAFGLDVWSRGRTYVSLGVYTVVSGAILLFRASQGYIAWWQTARAHSR